MSNKKELLQQCEDLGLEVNPKTSVKKIQILIDSWYRVVQSENDLIDELDNTIFDGLEDEDWSQHNLLDYKTIATKLHLSSFAIRFLKKKYGVERLTESQWVDLIKLEKLLHI